MSEPTLTDRLQDLADSTTDDEIRIISLILIDVIYETEANHRTALSRSDPRLFDPNTR